MKLTIGKKLGLCFGTLLGLMVVSSGSSYLKARTIQDVEARVYIHASSQKALFELQRDMNRAQSKGREIVLLGSQPAVEKARNQFSSNWKDVDKDTTALDELAPKWTDRENRERWAKAETQLANLRDAQEAGMNLASGGSAEAIVNSGTQYRDKSTAVKDPLDATLGEMADSFKTLLERAGEDVAAADTSMGWTMLISALLGLGIGIGMAFYTSRSISAGTSAVLSKAEAIAAGDLTSGEVQVHSNDELGDLATAMNKMQGNLVKMIVGVSENAQQVANASEEFSAASRQITSNSEETTAQANFGATAADQVNHNLQTVATGTEGMNSTIQKIAKNATESARVSGEAVRDAEATSAAISKLGASSAEIGQVIKVIASIAQQSNLLALNATIEAARLGESGKGFTAVANEVKELAKQTAKATEDISRKIAVIQADTNGAADAIATTGAVINQISDISTAIATAVEEQTATNNEISRNVTEAAKGSSKIKQNIARVSQAAQGTSSRANESMKGAQQLAQISTRLRGLVGQFKVSGPRQCLRGT